MLKSSQEVGLAIKELRIKKGLTQDQLAAKLQLTPQAVSKWENGDSYPDLPIIGMLTEIFEVSMDELMNNKNSRELKQHYRIHEIIENDKCNIEIKNVTPNNPCEITLAIKNRTNQRISLKPDNFVLLREDGSNINSKKQNIMDQYDEDVIGIKLLHEIPSFVPPQVSIELKLVFEAIHEVTYLWIDITDIVSSVSYIIRKNAVQTHQSLYSPAKLTRDELIDYYNYHYKKGEIPRTMTNFPKINMDILEELIIPKSAEFFRDNSYLFEQEVLTNTTLNNDFVDFNFVKQYITDENLLREIVKKNWNKIDDHCAQGKCSIIKYSEAQDFMDQDIIERIIILRAKYAKDYQKWTLSYINDENIARLKSELINMSFIENLKLFETTLSQDNINEVVTNSQIVELSQHQISKLFTTYKDKLSQFLIDKIVASVTVDNLDTLQWVKRYASSSLFDATKEKYFQKEQEKLNALKKEI
jgi:transcriptional regulator with XRE-family HTH domain